MCMATRQENAEELYNNARPCRLYAAKNHGRKQGPPLPIPKLDKIQQFLGIYRD